jgi:hypothetical protein
MPWSNPDILLHHGTSLAYAQNIKLHGIQPGKFKSRTDFGPGFYTTSNLTQATQMALRHIKLAAVKKQTIQGAILSYRIKRDDLARLDTLSFVRPEDSHTDLWNFIGHCRSGAAQHRAAANGLPAYYDIVIGPVAQNWLLHPYFCIPSFDQVSFHTPRALALLQKPIVNIVSP